MRYAHDEAVRIIEWLLPNLTDGESLVIELPFRDVRHRADVAILSPDRLSAIEIKGWRDNVWTLKDQVDAYQKMFLDVTVAVAPKHLMFATNELPSSVGLLLLDKKEVREIRKPRTRKLLRKEAATRWLRAQELSHLVGSSLARAVGVEEARTIVAKKFTSEVLTNQVLSILSQRNTDRYKAFLSELGSSVTLDDVQMLALPQRVKR